MVSTTASCLEEIAQACTESSLWGVNAFTVYGRFIHGASATRFKLSFDDHDGLLCSLQLDLSFLASEELRRSAVEWCEADHGGRVEYARNGRALLHIPIDIATPRTAESMETALAAACDKGAWFSHAVATALGEWTDLCLTDVCIIPAPCPCPPPDGVGSSD